MHGKDRNTPNIKSYAYKLNKCHLIVIGNSVNVESNLSTVIFENNDLRTSLIIMLCVYNFQVMDLWPYLSANVDEKN